MIRLIALADVKPLLNMRAGNTSYDTQLDALILTASRMIENECRQSFKKQERTEHHTSRDTVVRSLNLYGDGAAHTFGANQQIIPLRASPIDTEQPITVWYDPARRFEDYTQITDDHWSLDPEYDRILFHYPTEYHRSGLQVRYTAGYAEVDGSLSAALEEQAPDLKQAAILTVKHLWDITQSTGDEKGPKPVPGIPAIALNLIQPYRRVLTGRG